ncbi:MAG: glycine zipper 2TM domain-containing protein [Burkholderiales bacterium]|nr:glycine zipper 2TM domain-containing protein [Burkholderiales bacterium]
MKQRCLILLALLSFASAHAAGNDAAKSAYESAKKAADTRYSEDQKLCADESTSARRMQCLRDAKEEHTRALASAQSKLEAANISAPSATVCSDCGNVTSVRMTEKDGDAGAVGLIAGGVVGGLLGNQVGKGRGKDLATIAGVAGGAYAGNKVEGKMNKVKTWTVSVRFDNGEERAYNFDHDPAMLAGDPVRAAGSSIVRR